MVSLCWIEGRSIVFRVRHVISIVFNYFIVDVINDEAVNV